MNTPEPKPDQKSQTQSQATPKAESYLDALSERIEYANDLLAYFEALRIQALGAKVPKPYQKRWQFDSNLFFKMAMRTKKRKEEAEGRKGGK